MNEIQIFTNSQFGELRTMVIGGVVWFVAIDVCRAMDIEDTGRAVDRLDADEGTRIEIDHPQNPSKKLTVWAVNESGLYALVLGSRKAEARAFKRWITHEVIPSIRKHGMYATGNVLDQLLGDPDFGIRLLSELRQERDQRWALEEQNAEHEMIIRQMQPKVNYYDLILQNPDVVPITVIAKDYGMAGQALNQLLEKLKVQFKIGKMWVLYQAYAVQGYGHSVTQIVESGKVITFLCWTQKGRRFIYDLLKRECSLLPLIERQEVADAN